MSHTSREPSTKFLGPNARIFPIVTPVTVRLQLHNLTPGEFWIPGSRPALEQARILPRTPGTQIWNLYADDFQWWVLWTKTLARIAGRSSINGKFTFRLFLFYNCVRWGTSDLVVPADNFSYNGTVTISWIGA